MDAGRTAPRVVAFGGGTGLSVLLRGLAALGGRVQATAIVAVTDDGGSSGKLRRQLDLPAVGDARACLSAAAGGGDWSRLLEHRFQRAGPLRGHPAGNLLLAAGHELEGSLSRSLVTVGRLVDARCRVLPMTNARATLVARLAGGRVVAGESALAKVHGPIERVWLRPELAAPAPGVMEALAEADLIVLGPGSLFTSVIAATLAAGVAGAIRHSRALRVVVQNLTTQRGETDGMDARDHLRALRGHLGAGSVDLVLAHRWNGSPPAQGLTAGALSPESRLLLAELAIDDGRGRLHDSRLLASALYRLVRPARTVGIRRAFG